MNGVRLPAVARLPRRGGYETRGVVQRRLFLPAGEKRPKKSN